MQDGSFFQYASPYWRYCVVLLVPLFFYELRKLHLTRLAIPSGEIVVRRKKTLKAELEFVPPLLKMIAMALILFALARPQIGNQNTDVHSEGIDIVLALDTSESMHALDLQLDGKEADRMQVVKSVVKDFIDGREYDRIGMVVFGAQAYTQCPLTLDYDILKGYLDLIDVGIAGDATAIGNALATSVKRLIASQAKSRIVILLTDGDNTAGEVSPQAAAELAKDEGIKVYTIAVGSRAKTVPYPVKTPYGRQVRNVELSVDEDTLKKIAETTGGRFFRADTTDTLKSIYQTIDKLEKTDVKVEKFTEFDEQYLTYLIPGLIFLLASWILKQTIFLRVP